MELLVFPLLGVARTALVLSHAMSRKSLSLSFEHSKIPVSAVHKMPGAPGRDLWLRGRGCSSDISKEPPACPAGLGCRSTGTCAARAREVMACKVWISCPAKAVDTVRRLCDPCRWRCFSLAGAGRPLFLLQHRRSRNSFSFTGGPRLEVRRAQHRGRGLACVASRGPFGGHQRRGFTVWTRPSTRWSKATKDVWTLGRKPLFSHGRLASGAAASPRGRAGLHGQGHK